MSPRDLLADRRLRAALALGAVAVLGVTGTYAHWTDDAVVSGTSFVSGTLDLQVNNADSVATTTLSMAAMIPGSSSAEVLTLKNAGTAPLKYTMTGGLTGTDAAAYATAGALRLTVVAGGTRSGTGSAATCTGGTTLVNAVALTAVPSTAIIGTRRGPLAAAATESLCVQVALDGAAPSTLQGKTAALTLTATGTTDVS